MHPQCAAEPRIREAGENPAQSYLYCKRGQRRTGHWFSERTEKARRRRKRRQTPTAGMQKGCKDPPRQPRRIFFVVRRCLCGKAGAVYPGGAAEAALRLHHRYLRRGGRRRGRRPAAHRRNPARRAHHHPGGGGGGGRAAPARRRGGLGRLRGTQGRRRRPGRHRRGADLRPGGADGHSWYYYRRWISRWGRRPSTPPPGG